MLTHERLKELLDYNPETGLFTNKVTRRGRALQGKTAGGKDKDDYIVIRLDYELYRAHHLAWLYVYGVWPSDLMDHKNRIRYDNRIENVREATFADNLQNTGQYKTNKSGYRGVCFDKRSKKWRATIAVHHKQKYLGLFDTPEEAHEAYLKAKAQYHQFQPTLN